MLLSLSLRTIPQDVVAIRLFFQGKRIARAYPLGTTSLRTGFAMTGAFCGSPFFARAAAGAAFYKTPVLQSIIKK